MKHYLNPFTNILFDDFFSNEWPSYTRSSASHIEEEEDKYILEAEVPGVDKENIKIETKDNQLFIKAERKRGEKTLKFDDQLSLEKIDSEKIEASLEAGILRVILPKLSSAKSKTIKVF